jgi:hypothetical protein
MAVVTTVVGFMVSGGSFCQADWWWVWCSSRAEMPFGAAFGAVVQCFDPDGG